MKKHLFFSKSFKQNRHSLLIKWAFSAAILFFSQNAKACGFDYVSDCSTFSTFRVNGAETIYFYSYCTYRTAFPSTFGSNVTELKLTDGMTTTWESCTNHVIKSAILYRIYDNPSNKGSFIRVDLTQKSSAFDGVYASRTYEKAPASSLLAASSLSNAKNLAS